MPPTTPLTEDQIKDAVREAVTRNTSWDGGLNLRIRVRPHDAAGAGSTPFIVIGGAAIRHLEFIEDWLIPLASATAGLFEIDVYPPRGQVDAEKSWGTIRWQKDQGGSPRGLCNLLPIFKADWAGPRGPIGFPKLDEVQEYVVRQAALDPRINSVNLEDIIGQVKEITAKFGPSVIDRAVKCQGRIVSGPNGPIIVDSSGHTIESVAALGLGAGPQGAVGAPSSPGYGPPPLPPSPAMPVVSDPAVASYLASLQRERDQAVQAQREADLRRQQEDAIRRREDEMKRQFDEERRRFEAARPAAVSAPVAISFVKEIVEAAPALFPIIQPFLERMRADDRSREEAMARREEAASKRSDMLLQTLLAKPQSDPAAGAVANMAAAMSSVTGQFLTLLEAKKGMEPVADVPNPWIGVAKQAVQAVTRVMELGSVRAGQEAQNRLQKELADKELEARRIQLATMQARAGIGAGGVVQQVPGAGPAAAGPAAAGAAAFGAPPAGLVNGAGGAAAGGVAHAPDAAPDASAPLAPPPQPVPQVQVRVVDVSVVDILEQNVRALPGMKPDEREARIQDLALSLAHFYNSENPVLMAELDQHGGDEKAMFTARLGKPTADGYNFLLDPTNHPIMMRLSDVIEETFERLGLNEEDGEEAEEEEGTGPGAGPAAGSQIVNGVVTGPAA